MYGHEIVVPNAVNGIDVSAANLANGDIHFEAVKAAGFEFVYVQCTRYSHELNPVYEAMIRGAEKAGLVVGAYHFCSHDTDPVAQAEWFYKNALSLGENGGELPPMLDWEHCTPSVYVPPTYPEGHPQHCVTWLEQFAEEVDSLWYPCDTVRPDSHPTIYTYPYYAGEEAEPITTLGGHPNGSFTRPSGHQPALAQSKVLGKYPLTWASYKQYPTVPEDRFNVISHKVPNPWKDWTICQYSGDNGVPVPGVPGACDRLVFNGDIAAFRRFCGEVS